jgi:hypothetical protein
MTQASKTNLSLTFLESNGPWKIISRQRRSLWGTCHLTGPANRYDPVRKNLRSDRKCPPCIVKAAAYSHASSQRGKPNKAALSIHLHSKTGNPLTPKRKLKDPCLELSPSIDPRSLHDPHIDNGGLGQGAPRVHGEHRGSRRLGSTFTQHDLYLRGGKLAESGAEIAKRPPERLCLGRRRRRGIFKTSPVPSF